MTVLDDILDASTDPYVPTSDLLRRVQIAAHRLGAEAIVAWARSELAGYADDAALPDYRQLHTPVMGLFTGPMRSQIQQPLTVVPDGMEDYWKVGLTQPLAELQALSELDSDPGIQWPAWAVHQYEEAGVFAISMHNLFSASKVLTRQALRGIIDVVRTRAMEFALELQASFPDAGSVGGPTVATTPDLAQTVYNITNNITGHGTNVAAGPGAQQTSTVVVGDVASLVARLAEIGLSEDDALEFATAIQEEQSVDGPAGRRFLNRVRSGAVQLAAGLATNVAAEMIVAAGQSFLGLG